MSDAIIRVENGTTDELTTVFFECPQCGFSKVPYVGLPYPDLCSEERQTRVCPYCVTRIKWVRA